MAAQRPSRDGTRQAQVHHSLVGMKVAACDCVLDGVGVCERDCEGLRVELAVPEPVADRVRLCRHPRGRVGQWAGESPAMAHVTPTHLARRARRRRGAGSAGRRRGRWRHRGSGGRRRRAAGARRPRPALRWRRVNEGEVPLHRRVGVAYVANVRADRASWHREYNWAISYVVLVDAANALRKRAVFGLAKGSRDVADDSKRVVSGRDIKNWRGEG